MKNTINIDGIKLYAFHGCLEEEGRVGGEYIVNVSMEVDFNEAAITDDLNCHFGSANIKYYAVVDR